MYALALVWRERAGGQVEAPGLAAAPLAHVAISMIAETAKRPLLLRQPQKCTAWATPKMRRRCSRCRPNACSSKNRLLPPPHQVHVAQSEGGLTRVLEVDAQVGPAGLQGREAGGGAAALKPRALRRQCSDCRAATHAEIFSKHFFPAELCIPLQAACTARPTSAWIRAVAHRCRARLPAPLPPCRRLRRALLQQPRCKPAAHAP